MHNPPKMPHMELLYCMVLFIICIFVHYLAHERSCIGTCKCDTIESRSYSLAGLSPCVYCGMDESFTSSILSVRDVHT